MNIQESLGYLLNTSAKLIKRTMDNELEKYHITTSQWSVMKLLDTRKELTQTQIANELLGDRATAGEIILKLYEKNYIEKTLDKNDKRTYLVSLTPKTKTIIRDMEIMTNKIIKKALQDFDENDTQILYKSLYKIIDNLSKED